MMFILHNVSLFGEKTEIYGQNSDFIAPDWEKRGILSKKTILEKTRCVILFDFEWRMTIEEKFQNHEGDRFAREVAHYVEHLVLSKDIYQTHKITMSEKRRNLEFSQNDANLLFSWCSQYFEEFFPKT